MNIKYLIKLALFILVITLVIGYINMALEYFSLDPSSFWLGFGILAVFGFSLGLYTYLDNLGYTEKLAIKMEKWYFWKKKKSSKQ